MNYLKNIIIILFISVVFIDQKVYADTPYFIDFSKVLNQSVAGKAAQDKLKKKVKSETEKYQNQEKKIREEEKDLIGKKKLLSKDEYQKKVQALRGKIAKLQKSRQESFNKIAQSRLKAKEQLLKALNPIILKYMEENKIRIVLDKKSVLLGDTTLEITSKIIDILNKELKSIKID